MKRNTKPITELYTLCSKLWEHEDTIRSINFTKQSFLFSYLFYWSRLIYARKVVQPHVHRYHTMSQPSWFLVICIHEFSQFSIFLLHHIFSCYLLRLTRCHDILTYSKYLKTCSWYNIFHLIYSAINFFWFPFCIYNFGTHIYITYTEYWMHNEMKSNQIIC